MFHHQYYLNPLSFNPVLWIDFADASTVTTSAGDITQVVSKGSGAHVFAQAIAGNRPAYISAGLNGLNLARFNGTSDELLIGPSNLFRNVSGATVYAVRTLSTPPVTGRVLFDVLTATSVVRAELRVSALSLSIAAGRTLDADAYSNAVGSTASTPGAYIVHMGLFDYANTDLFVYLNGSVDGSKTSFNTATTTSNTASVASSIGSGVGASFFNGDICEILVFHTAHDNATRYAITQYLRTKWGI